jgi:hydrogenase small subunit
VHLHNPVLAYENGDEFMKLLVRGRGGRSIPSCWWSKARSPTRRSRAKATGPRWAPTRTGQPITTCEWIDRLAPKALAVVACGTCATYGGIHAMEGNPTGAWAWPTISAGTGNPRPACPIVNVPGCPVQPDNFMETLLYLLYQVAGLAPMIPLDEQLRPTWLFGKTVHEGCDRAGYYEQGDFATNTARPSAS